jgi:hypothetical protein
MEFTILWLYDMSQNPLNMRCLRLQECERKAFCVQVIFLISDIWASFLEQTVWGDSENSPILHLLTYLQAFSHQPSSVFALCPLKKKNRLSFRANLIINSFKNKKKLYISLVIMLLRCGCAQQYSRMSHVGNNIYMLIF